MNQPDNLIEAAVAFLDDRYELCPKVGDGVIRRPFEVA